MGGGETIPRRLGDGVYTVCIAYFYCVDAAKCPFACIICKILIRTFIPGTTRYTTSCCYINTRSTTGITYMHTFEVYRGF